jgi:phenylalanyl-tRNA synthetase beta chain
MKVLLSWLREFTPVEGDPIAVGEVMSDLGMAVEELDHVGRGLEGIVVARVLETRPVPGAKKIHQVVVDAGGGEPLEVGCGAFNMSEGDLVPLATVGAVMPNGMEIGRRKMAGVWSHGMLCSALELGLGEDHAGIMLLPRHLEPGAAFSEAMGIAPDDVRYELEINPNRPDAMSIAGVARDLAARLGMPFELPEPSAEVLPRHRLDAVSVEIADPDLCGRFAASVIRQVAVGPSDPTIATRLSLLGMRPLNNVVDVSNYVMLELGQPNHPYDLDRVAGPGFRVRRARDGETLVTLDDVERTFLTDDLLVCDADDTPIGIAGVMGGATSEISDRTTDVLLEMAWFLPIAVARTSRRLRLRSEASARFEKGCDPEVIDLAMARFAQLLAPTGARPESGMVDERGRLPDHGPVRLRTARLNRILGTDLSTERVRDLLDPIGFTARPSSDGDDLTVSIPSWRYDSATEIDVVEEVARHHGYTAIGRTVPSSTHIGALSTRQQERRDLRGALVGLGLAEAMPLPFLAPGQLKRCGLPDDGIVITNPLVAEESILRTSLLPGLVASVGYNASHRNHGVGLFEIGHVFNHPEQPGAALPDEREHLSLVWAGRDAASAVRTARVLADVLRIDGLRVDNAELDGLHPTRGARLVAGGVDVGSAGEVDPAVLEAHGITERVAWVDVDLDRVAELPSGERSYRPFSLYPSSDLDLAFEVDDGVPASAVEDELRAAGGELLWSLRLFDVYRGPGVSEGRRSLAFALRFQALDRTLRDDELSAVRQACIDSVESNLPAALRG